MNMKALTTCFFFALVILMCGCGSHYKRTVAMPTEAQVMNVDIGMSKLDVIETIGTPSQQFMVDGELVYSYFSLRDYEIVTSYKAYKIVFDKNNRVKKVLEHSDSGVFTLDPKERRLK